MKKILLNQWIEKSSKITAASRRQNYYKKKIKKNTNSYDFE